MRKNRMMRAASALLVAVLMTTCTISGTFAKYVTEKTASDTARVAKWGVTVTAIGDQAFFEKDHADGGASSLTEKKIVAPGSNGTLGTITIAGQPEVAVNVKRTATLTLEGWEIDGDEYCPIVITVNGTKYYVGKAGIADIAALKSAVETAIVMSKEYAPKTNLASTDDVSVSWSWDFGDVDAEGICDDEKDTALGNLVNGDNAPTITFAMGITVEQIDSYTAP